MIVRNYLDAPGKVQTIHKGKGQGKNARVFDKPDFDTLLQFINYVELEPGASIGAHRHGEDEEIYIVLSGRGVMRVNDERHPVKTGDIILNKPGWEHGLENTAQEPLTLLAFKVDKRGEG